MTAVKGKRGRLVHAWMPHGTRRDLAPEDIPTVVCGRKLSGGVITEDDIDCRACLEILFNQN